MFFPFHFRECYLDPLFQFSADIVQYTRAATSDSESPIDTAVDWAATSMVFKSVPACSSVSGEADSSGRI